MSDALYDTCVFIDYWRGDVSAKRLIDAVVGKKSTASFSPITAAELWQYSKLGRKEEIEYTALVRYFLDQALLTADAAIQAGQWLRPYSRNRRRRLAADALIAATAQGRGEPIISRNPRDLKLFYQHVEVY